MSHDLVVRGDDWDVAVVDGRRSPRSARSSPAGAAEIDARGLPGAAGRGRRPRAPRTTPGGPTGRAVDTGTRALAAGGATCCVDMPLNAHAADPRRRPPSTPRWPPPAARARVDFALWGGLVPGALDRHGRAGRARRGRASRPSCARAASTSSRRPTRTSSGAGWSAPRALGLPVAVHAEDPAIAGRPAAAAPRRGAHGHARLVPPRGRSRPSWRPSRTALALARETGCALHVVHVSSRRGGRPGRRGPARGAWT